MIKYFVYSILLGILAILATVAIFKFLLTFIPILIIYS
jgi:hypothetical protein